MPVLTPADLELLSAYLDNELTPAERIALERRLAQDADLRAALDDLRGVTRAIRGLPTLRAPRDFRLDPAVFGRQDVSPARPAARRRIPRRGYQWASGISALAAMLVFVLGVLALLGPSMLDSTALRSAEPAQSQALATSADEAFTGSAEDAVAEGAIAEEEAADEDAIAMIPTLPVTAVPADQARNLPLPTGTAAPLPTATPPLTATPAQLEPLAAAPQIAGEGDSEAVEGFAADEPEAMPEAAALDDNALGANADSAEMAEAPALEEAPPIADTFSTGPDDQTQAEPSAGGMGGGAEPTLPAPLTDGRGAGPSPTPPDATALMQEATRRAIPGAFGGDTGGSAPTAIAQAPEAPPAPDADAERAKSPGFRLSPLLLIGGAFVLLAQAVIFFLLARRR
jgi:hypothetical protein